MTVHEIAQITRGKLRGDGKREIRGVASLQEASSQDLTFAEDERTLERAAASHAGCILVPVSASLPGHTQIAVVHPKLAFIRATQVLYPAAPPAPGIHPGAVVSSEAQLAAGVSIGPGVVVERKVKVGNGTSVAAGVFLGEGVEVGSGCALYPRAILYPGARLGNDVVLHAGVVAGGDGFGYVFAEGKHQKFPQIGSVVIEDAVEIGANTTIDRGSLGATVIGSGTKIDNLVQIAHNVHIGRHCVIAAQTGISGSVEIGDYVVIGGQVGIGDHARIENRVVIGSQAGILPGKVIREGSVVWGTPARPLADFKKLYAHFAHLPALARKVNKFSGRR